MYLKTVHLIFWFIREPKKFIFEILLARGLNFCSFAFRCNNHPLPPPPPITPVQFIWFWYFISLFIFIYIYIFFLDLFFFFFFVFCRCCCFYFFRSLFLGKLILLITSGILHPLCVLLLLMELSYHWWP